MTEQFLGIHARELKTHILPYDHMTIGEGDGDPRQYSCLENPMDRGAW